MSILEQLEAAGYRRNGEGEMVGPAQAKRLEKHYQDYCVLPRSYSRVGYIDTWEYVQACFTEAAAQRYIDENRHNLKEPRIYAASGYRNREWIAVRKFLMGLDKDPAALAPSSAAEHEIREE